MLTTIISGGQTGADQGALEAAVRLGLSTGGWMPKGWLTEDGPRPDLGETYGLVQHRSTRYAPRTARNVRDSDATVWLGTEGTPGFKATRNAAERYRRPFLAHPDPLTLRAWVNLVPVRILHVAGNRESKNPGIRERTAALLLAAFGPEAA